MSKSEENPKTILIEQTSKKLKMDLAKAQIFFVVVFLIGILVTILLWSKMGSNALVFGGIGYILSVIPLIIVKVKIWWHHQ
jgi:uncharacterized protein YacL